MPPRDQFTFHKGEVHMPNMRVALIDSTKRPVIGLTQGGSSRKYAGAKPAAVDADIYHHQKRPKNAK